LKETCNVAVNSAHEIQKLNVKTGCDCCWVTLTALPA